MEAKYQVLQEAISGGIIAAIIAIATAIIALIVKCISMMKDGTTKLKEKVKNKKEEKKEFTEERKKELEEKIKNLVEQLDVDEKYKDKLMNFNNNDLTNHEEFKEMREMVASFKHVMSEVKSSISSIHKDHFFIDEFFNLFNEFGGDDVYWNDEKTYGEIKGEIEENIEEFEEESKYIVSINSVVLLFTDNNISGGPAKAREYVKQFLLSNISNKSIDILNGFKKQIADGKNILEKESEKIINDFTKHIKDMTDDTAFVNLSLFILNGIFKKVKIILSSFQLLCNNWMRLEKFRLQYANIVLEYV